MSTPCPCQSGASYENCCAPFHQGQTPENAEQLMRSRYSAYTQQNIAYIVATTVPAQQDLLDQQDMLNWSQNTQWLGLKVEQHIPKIGKHHAQVAFTAFFANQTSQHEHHELSTFVRINNRWYFIDPTVPLPSMKSPCICGSGKKFKQCCGQFFK